MKLPQKEQVKKLDLKCVHPKKGCIYTEKGKTIICPISPCPINKFKFGQHERIFEQFIDNGKWDNAYFYFQDWLPLFVIECKIEDFDKIQNEDLKNIHPGCRVFIISKKLKEIRKNLKIYSNLNEDISKQGKLNYNEAKNKFISKLNSAIDLLKHLSMDKRSKKIESDDFQSKLLGLYDKIIEANKKYGITTQKSFGTFIEKGIEKTAINAGLETKKLAEFNKERVKKAKMEMDQDKLKSEILDLLKNKEALTPDVILKMKELGIDIG